MTASRRQVTVPSRHLVEQAGRVAALLDAGHTNRQIAEELGVSPPRISQIRRALPTLIPYLGEPKPLDRLRDHRQQLWNLRRDTLLLAATIRRDLRELDEESEAATIDLLLGLRR